MKIKIFIRPMDPYLKHHIKCGWGNGYAIIPRKHALYRYCYDDIHLLHPKLQVNGGLTFSAPVKKIDWPELPKHIKSGWVVGFDTAHFNDTPEKWPEEEVLKETKRLKMQLESYIAVKK